MKNIKVEHPNKKNQVSERDIIIVITLATAIVLVFFFYVNFIPKSVGSNKISAEIIQLNGCDNCFDLAMLDPIIQQIENIEIKSDKAINYDSDEAKRLIEKYNIKTIPALIITSRKIDKLTLDENIFRKEKNVAIFDKAVPHIYLESGEIKGIVNLKEVYDPTCMECKSLSAVKVQLEQSGIKIDEYLKISSSLDIGQKLIKDNNMTSLPTLLISKEIKEYWWIFNQLENFVVETKDYYKFNEPLSPYKDIATDEIKGIVNITFLVNNSCTDCFNITKLKPSLQEMGIFINSEKYVDISSSEGRTILAKYNITAIPAFILSKEISDYAEIKDILAEVGTFESDNSYVLRALDKLNVEYQILNES